MALFLAISSKIFWTSVKYAYPVDRFYHVIQTGHVSNLKMVVFEMTSITVRWRDRDAPGFPSGKKNDFIGRYLIGLQTDLKIDEDHSVSLRLSTSLCDPPSPPITSNKIGFKRKGRLYTG